MASHGLVYTDERSSAEQIYGDLSPMKLPSCGDIQHLQYFSDCFSGSCVREWRRRLRHHDQSAANRPLKGRPDVAQPERHVRWSFCKAFELDRLLTLVPLSPIGGCVIMENVTRLVITTCR